VRRERDGSCRRRARGPAQDRPTERARRVGDRDLGLRLDLRAILALRGLFPLLAPQAGERMAVAPEGAATLIRAWFDQVFLCGLWLADDGGIAPTPPQRY
jgi:hypothetical protein